MKNIVAIYSNELPLVSIAEEEDKSATVYCNLADNHILKSLHYSSLWAILISMLYDETWRTIWSDDERERLISIINKVYFFRIVSGCANNIQSRMRLLRAYSSEMDFNYQTRVHGDDIAKSEFMIQTLDAPPYYTKASYEGMLKLVEEKHLCTDTLKVFYSFPSIWDMACWLLERAIQENKRVLKCQNCGNLFFPDRVGMVYCGKDCRKAWSKKMRLEGDIEIEKEYAAILAVFKRREMSHGDYVFDSEEATYGEELARLFTDEINERIKKSRSGKTRIKFYQDDFRWIHSNFLKENKARWRKVKKAKENNERTEFETSEYLRLREEYLNWLKRIHVQICSFRLTY